MLSYLAFESNEYSFLALVLNLEEGRHAWNPFLHQCDSWTTMLFTRKLICVFLNETGISVAVLLSLQKFSKCYVVKIVYI